MPLDVRYHPNQHETEVIIEDEGENQIPQRGILSRLSHFLLGDAPQRHEEPAETVKVIYKHVHHYPEGKESDHRMHELLEESKDSLKRKGHRAKLEWDEKTQQWKDTAARGANRARLEWDEKTQQWKRLGHEVKEGVHEAIDELEDEGEQLMDDGKRKASGAMNYLRESFKHATRIMHGGVKEVEEKAERATETLKDDLESAKENASRVTDRAKAKGKNVKDAVKDTYVHATEAIKNAEEEVKERVEEVWHNANNAVKENAARATDTVKDTLESAAEKAKHVKESIKENVEAAGEHVKDEVNGAWHKAGYAWNRFEQCLGCPPRRNDLSTYRRKDLAGRTYGYRLGDPNPLPITAFYTALSTLWFLWLLRRVWLARKRSKIYVGDGSTELAHELSKQVTVTRVSKPNGVSGKHAKSNGPSAFSSDEEGETRQVPTMVTTATLQVEDRPAIRKYLSLVKAVSTHRSFATTVPFLLALLAIMETNGAARPLLHLMYIVFTISQLAQSDFGKTVLGPNRDVGTVGVMSTLLMGSLATLYYILGCRASF
ncbi:hypothetical protein HK104_005806 [Borealophlyctis nickersoniae]|nr:hypothetical protein HK104_005806 [Borealophlyctis nickersoniae]